MSDLAVIWALVCGLVLGGGGGGFLPTIILKLRSTEYSGATHSPNIFVCVWVLH